MEYVIRYGGSAGSMYNVYNYTYIYESKLIFYMEGNGGTYNP